MARILLACEESQSVTTEFRALGHEAYSCDILDTSGSHPEWHLKQDVTRLLFLDTWDLIIAFPPCTHLASSGARWFAQKRADGRQQSAIDFFMLFTNCACDRVAIENPVGIMSTTWRSPDQTFHPYHFGDPFEKRTCLWLKGLPKLQHTNVVEPPPRQQIVGGKSLPEWYSNAPKKDRARFRSKTFPGLAKAMATQWGSLL